MRSRLSLTLSILILFTFYSACSRREAVNTSTTAALGSNATTARMFERKYLGVAGLYTLNDFIRPDVRERLDKEPGSQDEESIAAPAEIDTSSAETAETGETEKTEVENTEGDDDQETKNRNLDKVKFLWAKKKLGDALAADPNINAAIILYADENYYDINRLLLHIDEGRDRIASESEIDASRIQVIFGGYRGAAQVEMWVIPAGGELPEPKPEDRDASGPDN